MANHSYNLQEVKFLLVDDNPNMTNLVLGVLIARGAKLPSSNQEGELVKRNRISK